jgi:hypothetical protein
VGKLTGAFCFFLSYTATSTAIGTLNRPALLGRFRKRHGNRTPWLQLAPNVRPKSRFLPAVTIAVRRQRWRVLRRKIDIFGDALQFRVHQ